MAAAADQISVYHKVQPANYPHPQMPEEAKALQPQTLRSNVAYHCNRRSYHRRGLREVRSVMTPVGRAFACMDPHAFQNRSVWTYIYICIHTIHVLDARNPLNSLPLLTWRGIFRSHDKSMPDTQIVGHSNVILVSECIIS